MESKQARAYKADILVVDDTPENLSLLSSMLSQHGYRIRGANSGKTALSSVRLLPPDLILLDVHMPGLTGYDVCQQLKADANTQEIPIIFISAHEDLQDKVKAFEAGGVDYITKPFQVPEVLARIETHLKLHRLQQQLQEHNVRLHQEIRERQQAEEKYRSIFENSIEGMFQVAPDGHFLTANSTLAQMYKYDSPEELIEQVRNVAKQLYVQAERRAEFVAYMHLYDNVSDFVSEVYCKDGSKIWISENVRTVKGPDGKVLYYEGSAQDITERRRTELELRYQRQKAEHLLASILPLQISQRLKQSPQIIADSIAEVTVMFADIVGFTELSNQFPPVELIGLLNDIFSVFDRLSEEYGLEKIKTIGDAYMVVGGVPKAKSDHAATIADMALAMQAVMKDFSKQYDRPLSIRIGINTGPVIAGVIGKKKFTYDLWGDTVNVASRMESLGEPDRIQITTSTYEHLKDSYIVVPRGTINVKGKGELLTYWLMDKR